MIIAHPISSQLRLIFYDGEDVKTGKPVYQTKNFNNVKPDATDEQLYAVAEYLEDLQQRPLYSIERRDASEIIKE